MIDPIAAIAKFAGSITPKGWIVAGGIALLVAGVTAAVLIADNAVEDTLNTAEKAGEAKAVSQGYETTLDQLEKANEAENAVRLDRDNARYTACLRDVAPGYAASCERYRQPD